MLIFNHKNTRYNFNFKGKPTVILDKIHFITTDNDWHNRLLTAILTIIITGLDDKGQELKSSSVQIVLSEFISARHSLPVLHVDRQIGFNDLLDLKTYHQCEKWIVSIEIHNLALKNNEQLDIDIEIKENGS